MVHVRTQLRQRFKAVLDGALPSSDYRVYASRKSALNHVSNLTTVDMKFLNDQTQQASVMDRRNGDQPRTHVASLYVRVQRSADETLLEAELDADEVLIVNAVDAHDWSDILEEEPELVQVNFSDDGSAGRTLGAIVLRYDLEYRINKHDPETTIA